ncbi:MAG: aldo/keto reductase, partial [Proteiniphilum sp.]|nr:aldo/keto reductase [Proteiniphilum sp.]
KSEEESLELLEQALAGGLYYWDTASIYASADGKIISEERVGQGVKNHRNQIFLSTKVTARDPNEAMRSIELSLRRLQTDHLDILKIHDVHSHEDNQKILQKGGLIDILHRMKEEKVTRFIGFSGHAEPSALTEIIDKGDFDCMLFAMNHWPGGLNNTTPRREQVIPKALEKNMGIMLMKVIRPLDTVEGVNAEELIRYALSLEGAHGITVGIDSLKVLQSNLKILKEFAPMEEQEKQRITATLAPFFQSRDLPWMNTNYCDGYWT